MATVEVKIGAADKYLDDAKQAVSQPWTADQFLAAAQVQAFARGGLRCRQARRHQQWVATPDPNR
ncbi:MAG: hypothetical protein LC799_06500 [Actinobacteria bacterium]|nr:hypothetical protein [Actinomycetota bacterium]